MNCPSDEIPSFALVHVKNYPKLGNFELFIQLRDDKKMKFWLSARLLQ